MPSHGPHGLVEPTLRLGYPVSIRNSVDASVTLVKRGAWDLRQESLANTWRVTDPGFRQRGQGRAQTEPWPFLLERAHAASGVADVEAVAWALRAVIRESLAAGVSLSDEPWQVVDALLSLPDPVSFEAVIGVPAADAASPGGTLALDTANKVLDSLARFTAESGFARARDQLADAAASLLAEGQLQEDVQPALAGLFEHLASRCESAVAFRQSPMRGFRAAPDAAWHATLGAGVLARLLERVGASDRRRSGSSTRCTNALNPVDRAKDEPIVVRGEVDLRALVDVPPLPPVEFERRVTRGFTALPRCRECRPGRRVTPPRHPTRSR